MGGNKQPPQRGEAASGRDAAELRERAAGKYDALDDERDRMADERERKANEREHLADERERLADERERRTDERELQAENVEVRAGERARELGERKRRLGGPAQGILGQQVADHIERSRALVEATRQRLQRRGEALDRVKDRAERQQAEIDRASAESERSRTAWQLRSRRPIERAEALRERACDVIKAFADAEDEVARVHEELAASNPGHSGQYRHAAEEAHSAAHKAREALRAFID